MDDQQRARELAHKIGVYYTRKGSTALEDGFFGFTETELQEFAAALRAAPEWQPIETAPRDGSPVWAFNGEQAPMLYIAGEGYALWIWADQVLADIDPSPEQPKHWKPLPNPPLAARPQGVKS